MSDNLNIIKDEGAQHPWGYIGGRMWAQSVALRASVVASILTTLISACRQVTVVASPDQIFPDIAPSSSPISPPVINLPDVAPPRVTSFVIPESATSLAVEIGTFTATDDIKVTGYLITESASVPHLGALGWSVTAPDTFTFSAPGNRTAHAWVRDAAGNVSDSFSAAVTITLPPNLPNGPHPRIWLDVAEMSRLVAKRESNDPSWTALLSWCQSHLNDAGYNIDPVNQSTQDLTNWGGHNNYTMGYRMSGFSNHLLNYGIAYQILKAPGLHQDLQMAAAYAARTRTLLIDGIATALRSGEEMNGLKAIRVGSLHDITVNANEATVLGIGNAGYKQGYSSRSLAAIPIAYDWIHDTLSPADKELLSKMMLRWFDWLRGTRSTYNNGVLIGGIRYHEDKNGDCTGNNDCTTLSGTSVKAYAFDQIANNFGGGHAYLSLLIPVALYGDNEDIPAYLDTAKSYMIDSVISPLESDVRHSGGDSTEGWNYGGGFIYTLLGLYGYYTGTGDPAIPAMSWIPKLIEATAYRVLDVPIYGYWTGTPYGESRIGTVTRFVGIEQKLRPDSTMSGIGQYLLNYPSYSGSLEQWESFLFKNDSISEILPSMLPIAYVAKGNGLFTSRSSWTDANTVHLSVRLEGKVETAHEGYDEGHISLARGPDRLLVHQNSIGDAPPSVSFNTIVFNGQSHHAANPGLISPAIDRHEVGAAYSYASGDITNAYKRSFNADRALLFRRSVLHVLPGFIITYDVTRSNSALGNLKEWYTQYLSNPTTTSDTISATVGSSNVFVKVLYPTGGTFTATNPSAGYYRVKYVPAIQQEYDQFLHVIEASGSAALQAPSSAISVTSGMVRGVQVGNVIAMFTSNQDGSSPSGSLSYQYSSTDLTTHYLASLSPGTRYDIVAASGTLTCSPATSGAYTVSPNGLLVLSVTTAGVVSQVN